MIPNNEYNRKHKELRVYQCELFKSQPYIKDFISKITTLNDHFRSHRQTKSLHQDIISPYHH